MLRLETCAVLYKCLVLRRICNACSLALNYDVSQSETPQMLKPVLVYLSELQFQHALVSLLHLAHFSQRVLVVLASAFSFFGFLFLDPLTFLLVSAISLSQGGDKFANLVVFFSQGTDQLNFFRGKSGVQLLAECVHSLLELAKDISSLLTT